MQALRTGPTLICLTLVIVLVLAGCQSQTFTPTPSLATTTAPTQTSVPKADIQATISASVDATIEAMPSETPPPTFTPTPTATATPTATPTLTPTPTPTPTYKLTIRCISSGDGTVSPQECETTSSYSEGTELSFIAVPASGSGFAGWSGACTGNGRCTVIMDTNKRIEAIFLYIH